MRPTHLSLLLWITLVGCHDVEAPVDAGVDAAEDPDVPCTTAGLAAPRACTLDAWPTLSAVAAADLTTQAQTTSVAVPGRPAGMLVTPDGGWVLTALAPTTGNGRLGVLKRQGSALTFDHGIDLPASGAPFGLTLSPDHETVAVSVGTLVAFLDLAKIESGAADAVLGTAPDGSAQGTAIDLAFSRDGKLVFVCTEYDRGVAVIDVATRTLLGAIPIAGNAVTSVATSPDGKYAYVVNETADEFLATNPHPAGDDTVGAITVVDVAKAGMDPTSAIVGRVFAGRAPVRIVLTADGATAWVTARGSNAILAFDAQKILTDRAYALLATTAVGLSPVGVALVKNDTGLLVANSDRFTMPTPNGTLALVDAAQARAGTGGVVGQIAVEKFPREMDADASSLFVSNSASSSVSAIALAPLTP